MFKIDPFGDEESPFPGPRDRSNGEDDKDFANLATRPLLILLRTGSIIPVVLLAATGLSPFSEIPTEGAVD